MVNDAVVIMAGGRSKRFGSNKALVSWKGKTLIENVLEKAARACPNLVLSVAKPDDFRWLDVQKVVDRIKGIGPMGGLYSCLKTLPYENVLLVACDMPMLSPELIGFMLEYQCDEPILIPRTGERLHPLHARYHRSLLPVIEKLITKNRYKMAELFNEVPVNVITPSDVKPIDLGFCLSNINTPDDLKKIKNIF